MMLFEELQAGKTGRLKDPEVRQVEDLKRASNTQSKTTTQKYKNSSVSEKKVRATFTVMRVLGILVVAVIVMALIYFGFQYYMNG
jgi:uncharacterized membrane protein YukC